MDSFRAYVPSNAFESVCLASGLVSLKPCTRGELDNRGHEAAEALAALGSEKANVLYDP